MFLRTPVPVYGPSNYGTYDVKFDILDGNVENAFDILTRAENGLYVGKWKDLALLSSTVHCGRQNI